MKTKDIKTITFRKKNIDYMDKNILLEIINDIPILGNSHV